MRIGFIGYSAQKFDSEQAKTLIQKASYEVNPNDPVVVVSGLTNIGVPALAYEWAKEKGYKTMGIACAKAKDYDCFPVDRTIIVGDEWGDESMAFLAAIDSLVRIGGGPQSLAECQAAKDLGITVYEYDLEGFLQG